MRSKDLLLRLTAITTIGLVIEQPRSEIDHRRGFCHSFHSDTPAPHVSRILDKLGFSCRVEIVAWVVERRLREQTSGRQG